VTISCALKVVYGLVHRRTECGEERARVGAGQEILEREGGGLHNGVDLGRGQAEIFQGFTEPTVRELAIHDLLESDQGEGRFFG
jgi:hypothetical protein